MPTPQNVAVLLVEADDAVAQRFHDSLVLHGMEVLRATDKHAALQHFVGTPPDAVVLDSDSPGMPAFQLLERIRRLSDVPVLELGGQVPSTEAIRALNLGADCFLRKPCDADEVAARVRAVVRRTRTATVDSFYLDGHVELDLKAQEARTVNGDVVDLSPLQFRLLAALVSHRNQALAPRQLLRAVWGPGAESVDRVKVQVSLLRHRLALAGVARDVIQTVAGVGYRYRDR